MAGKEENLLRKTYFEQIDMGDGKLLNVPKTRLKSLGAPPWELEIDDMWVQAIPQEANDLVGTLIWRGIRFERSVA